MKPDRHHIAQSWLGAIHPITACGLLLFTSFTLSGADMPWRRHTIDSSFVDADGVRLADINRDGLPDITTGWEEAGRVRVYSNPGHAESARQWPAVTVGAVASPEDAVFVDLDGDGAIDVVSSCEGKNRTMFIHWAPAINQTVPNPCQEFAPRCIGNLPVVLIESKPDDHRPPFGNDEEPVIMPSTVAWSPQSQFVIPMGAAMRRRNNSSMDSPATLVSTRPNRFIAESQIHTNAIWTRHRASLVPSAR